MRAQYRASVSNAMALAVIALAPLPFGSVEVQWICAWIALLGASLAIAKLDGGSVVNVSRLWPVGLGMSAAVLATALQGAEWVGRIYQDPIWSQAAAALHVDQTSRAVPTARPGWLALGPSILVCLTFLRIYLLAQDPKQAERVIKVAGWSCLAYAVFGVVSLELDPNVLLWRTKEAYVQNLTGTFVNRNTAATYFGCGAALWLAVGLRAVDRTRRQGAWPEIWRDRITWFMAGRVSRNLLGPFAACVALTVAVAMTASRAGMALSLVGLALLCIVWRQRSFKVRLWPAALVVVAIGLAVESAGGLIAVRFESRGLGDAFRWETYRLVLSMVFDHPWLGVGLGAFNDVFPSYREAATPTVGAWDKAHSTPLEIMAELGIPAFVAIAVSWAALALNLTFGALRRRQNRIFPTAGLICGLVAVMHSSIDFSLQIPGLAVFVAALAGAGLAHSASERTKREVSSRSSAPSTRSHGSDGLH